MRKNNGLSFFVKKLYPLIDSHYLHSKEGSKLKIYSYEESCAGCNIKLPDISVLIAAP